MMGLYDTGARDSPKWQYSHVNIRRSKYNSETSCEYKPIISTRPKLFDSCKESTVSLVKQKSEP